MAHSPAELNSPVSLNKVLLVPSRILISGLWRLRQADLKVHLQPERNGSEGNVSLILERTEVRHNCVLEVLGAFRWSYQSHSQEQALGTVGRLSRAEGPWWTEFLTVIPSGSYGGLLRSLQVSRWSEERKTRKDSVTSRGADPSPPGKTCRTLQMQEDSSEAWLQRVKKSVPTVW